MSRECTLTCHCGHDGCKERATFRYSSRREMMSSLAANNYTNGRWRCTRHARPSEVLGVGNTSTRHELIVEQKLYGRFFGPFGFVFGPGFRAFASDFPPGTKIIVRAEVVFPDSIDTPDQIGAMQKDAP